MLKQKIVDIINNNSPELASEQIIEMLDLDNIYDVIQWISGCPYAIDDATVPRNGIDVAPEQVVGNMSLKYTKYKQLCEISKKLNSL